MDDDRDMASVVSGDSTAFERIVQRHQARLIGWLDKRSRGNGEDLAQEVFIRVWMNASRYKSQHTFTAWLFRIAHNLLIDRSRRKTVRAACFGIPDDDESSVIDLQPDPYCDPAEVATRRDDVSAAFAAMRRLPQEQCDTLESYAEGWTLSEIATMSGCCLATAKGRLRLARCRVIGILQQTE